MLPGRRERKAQARKKRLQDELNLWKSYVKERLPNAQACYFMKDAGYNRGHVILLKPLDEDGREKFELFRVELPSGVDIVSRFRHSARMAWKSAYLELKKYEEGKKDSPIFKEFIR